ncbi:predicted protein [Naegleria gruberi]|uniref:Predicted protein n=1 Tax=Naegleria gruberi TaxID=5762 RepID=D2VC10_NAEGR|nr:uncharacterized protein NAEGRDRAFT_66406 [Naegleria gruberi]EFC45574.1 predicted protein [Naegleria gruberi]|eukprot:XP_002678318.1 predicted protein [Naegleria gruberi strain NEG-M]
MSLQHALQQQSNSITFVEMENLLITLNIDSTNQLEQQITSTILSSLPSAHLNNSTSITTTTGSSQQLSTFKYFDQSTSSSTLIKIIEEGNNDGVNINKNISIQRKKEFIIKTKCGQLELTFDRILAFIIMLLAIITLLILVILSTGTIFLQTNTENKTFNNFTKVTKNLIRLNAYYTILMESKLDELLIEEINETMIDVKVDYNKLLIDIPYYGNTAQYSRSRVVTILNRNFKSLESNHNYIYNEIIVNNYTDTKFFYSNYHPSLVNFTQSLDLALILADKAASNEDEYMNINAIIDLSLVGFVLIIIIPSIGLILIKSAVNDNKFMEKLQKADARIVIETIADPRYQSYFKELCKEHNQLSKYLFMERVQLFNEICQRVFTLQDEIEEGVNLEMSKKMLIEIDDLEAKKFELSFELITEYLDLGSDTFLGFRLVGRKRSIEKIKKIFDTQSMNLPENLFKNIQSNVSLNLLPIYKLFKSNQQRKRNERKIKIIAKQQDKHEIMKNKQQ